MSGYKAVSNEDDDKRGSATAEQIKGEYMGLGDTSHTSLLVGQRYLGVVERILEWLNRY
jgi:hypothetical protein